MFFGQASTSCGSPVPTAKGTAGSRQVQVAVKSLNVLRGCFADFCSRIVSGPAVRCQRNVLGICCSDLGAGNEQSPALALQHDNLRGAFQPVELVEGSTAGSEVLDEEYVEKLREALRREDCFPDESSNEVSPGATGDTETLFLFAMFVSLRR